MLLAVAGHLGIHSELIPRMGTGFCAGLSRAGGICGAVAGAIMGIGLGLGRNDPAAPVDPCFAATQKLLARFNESFGTTNCRALIGLDLADEQQRQAFWDRGLHIQCRRYTEQATRLAIELLAEPTSIAGPPGKPPVLGDE